LRKQFHSQWYQKRIKIGSGMLGYTQNVSYLGGGGKRVKAQGRSMRLFLKSKLKEKRTGGVFQVVECLPSTRY
jgi:hypothetical protein